MEKNTPHTKLAHVKALIGVGKVRMTASAVMDAGRLGCTEAGMLNVVMSLTMADFYKSMTTYSDHRIWQDVDRPNTLYGDVYLKLTVVDDVLIVSFKELSK